MSRHRLSLGCFCLMAASAQAGPFTNWWLTPDQQAQRALEAGDPKQAARLFADPRRRAFAESQSQQYESAAKRLACCDDAASQYNRGNALAHQGELKPALQAYDAALKHAPPDSPLRRDAQHNRDLVARQMRDQKDPQQSNHPQPEKKPSDQPHDDKAPAEANKNDAEQAKKEVEAASKPEPDAARPKDPNPPAAQAKAARPTDGANQIQSPASVLNKPPTEQALAAEQWLKQIPDDPGGLLRRKFLIEHMMKQREASR